MADSILPGYSQPHWKWQYEHGLFLQAIMELGAATGDPCYEHFVHEWVDYFVSPKGSIRTYCLSDFNLDLINPGNLLFYFHNQNGRYLQAIELLGRQLQSQPRTESGGFWHKKIYPHQIWLDGLYMAAPFYARYARLSDDLTIFDDVARQVILIEKMARDPKTGLLYHAWDESRQQKWADPKTGRSPNFWGRSIGWYAMALVELLEILPAAHPSHQEMVAILERMSHSLLSFQDPESGLWYQVVDMPDRPGNYRESSVSAMLAYVFAKAVRKDYLPAEYLPVARRTYHGLLENKIKVNAHGRLTLEGICGVAGLGGNPYRDGSFEYYISEKTVANDFKGVGPFILAALEMESAGVE